MRLLTPISLALACLQVNSFSPGATPNRISTSIHSSKSIDEAPCAIPSEFTNDASSLVNMRNGANPIRSGMVTNYAGESIQLGNVISKSDPHVVIFLRHMGWPYCWSYAKEWYSLNVQQQLLESGIRGPTFVSIGDSEKLNTFLDANPWMDKQQMFVDDYEFQVYKAAGFTRFDQVDKEKAKSVKLSAPDLKFGEWIDYFKIVGKVSPSKCSFKSYYDYDIYVTTC